MSMDSAPIETPPDTPGVVSRICRKASLVGAVAGAACGAIVALVAAWYFSTSGEAAGAYALPGSTWRTKHEGKDIFLEFKEDMILMNWDAPPGAPSRGEGDFGHYEIIGRNEFRLDSPMGRGRFAVFLAGENVVLENRSTSARIFLHHVWQPDKSLQQQERCAIGK